MKSCIVNYLAGLCVAVLLVGCGGDSSSSIDEENETVQISGAGIKGPMAFADVKIYAMDQSFPELYDKTSPISVAITNQNAEINGLSVPRRIRPPYILTIDGSNGIDLNTGVAPAIGTLITVITGDMLSNNRPVFATPLTTLMYHMARLSTFTNERMKRGTAKKAFVGNLKNAASIAGSTFILGQDRSIDLFRSPLIINESTGTSAEQEQAVYHRASVEAFAANVYLLAQQEGVSADSIIERMALDIHTDGLIDNSDNGTPVNSKYPMVLSQNPMNLQIPNTAYRVNEILQLMSEERFPLGTDRGPVFFVDEIAFPEDVKTTDTDSMLVSKAADGFTGADSTVLPAPIYITRKVKISTDTNSVLVSRTETGVSGKDTIVVAAPIVTTPNVTTPDVTTPDVTTFTDTDTVTMDDTSQSESNGTETNVLPEPVITLSAARINFGSQYVGETGDPIELVITNAGEASFSINSMMISADYLETNNCDSQIRTGESCIVDIQFYPTTTGLVEGVLTISGDVVDKQYAINLSGFGMDLAEDDTRLTGPRSPGVIFYYDFNDEPLHTYTQADIKGTWNASQQFAKNSTINIVQDPDPSGAHGNVMRAFYAANTVTNKNESGFYFRKKIGSHNEMYFAYDVFFEDDAEFTKGGKLPGLGIPDYFSNSGVSPDGTDRWTGGLAWRADGKIANYVYHANQPGKYGEILFWDDGAEGQAYFKRGEWNRVEIYYKMNTPGMQNGRIKGWLNGKLALDSSRPMYRMPGGEHLTIGAIAMATMYGGGKTFAPLTDQNIYFDNFVVSTQPITH